MSTEKVKVYKNPARAKSDTFKPYIPQYQTRGIEPEEYVSPLAPNYSLVVKSESLPKDNPRAPRAVVRQPYAEAVPSPIGRGKGPVPNVGNNMEHTWSSIDGEIIDDISSNLEENHPMIDNNEFVTPVALELSEEPNVLEVPVVSEPESNNFLTEEELKDALKEEDLHSILGKLGEGDYLLLVSGVAICSGSLDDIEDVTRDLIFGEHELCDGNSVPADDIIVIKRVKIKVGVFLE